MEATSLFGIEARGAEINLERQRAAGEEGGEADDGQRVVADAPHLQRESGGHKMVGVRPWMRPSFRKIATRPNLRQEGKHGAADGLGESSEHVGGSESRSE